MKIEVLSSSVKKLTSVFFSDIFFFSKNGATKAEVYLFYICLQQGAYLNIDHFKSRVELLSRSVGKGEPAKRVGNQDFS